MGPVLEINFRCISCDNCLLICPEDAIYQAKNEYYIDHWSCTLCGICQQICPVDSIHLVTPTDDADSTFK